MKTLMRSSASVCCTQYLEGKEIACFSPANLEQLASSSCRSVIWRKSGCNNFSAFVVLHGLKDWQWKHGNLGCLYIEHEFKFRPQCAHVCEEPSLADTASFTPED